MAKRKLVVKSFRTLVGTLGPDTRFGQGVYIYDTNDSETDFGFFALFAGLSPEAEQFGTEYIAKATAHYLDSTRTENLGRSGEFLKSLMGSLLAEFVSCGLVDPNSAHYSAAIALVRGGILTICRVNAGPVFFFKDKKPRRVFKAPKMRGIESIQVESVSPDNGDILVL